MSGAAREETETMADGLLAQSHCTTVADFSSPAARDLIGRVLAAFLDQLVITPGELVHSGRHLKRLGDSGRVLMNAVDKVGTLQAKRTGEGAAARIRDLHALVSAATRQAWEDDRDCPPPAVSAETFASVIAALPPGGTERERALGRVLAEHLASQKTWRDKAAALVRLAEACAGGDDFAVVDLWLAETLRSDAALDQLLGFAERLEERCHDLIALWQGDWQPRDTAAPVMADIARLIAGGNAPALKAAIEFALLRVLAGKEPLRSAEPEIEIAAIADLFRRLWNDGQVVGGPRALALLERRQARHLTSEGITDLLRERKVMVDRLACLLQLAALAVGSSNRATLKVFIDHYFGDQDFVPRAIAGQEPPIPKMQTLAAVHRALKASWLPDEDKAAAMARVEAAQAELLRRSRLFEQIEKKGGGPAQKALTLLDLFRKGTFIDGEPLERVRRAISAYVADPAFATEYLGGSHGEERGRKAQLLARMLSAIGLDPATAAAC